MSLTYDKVLTTLALLSQQYYYAVAQLGQQLFMVDKLINIFERDTTFVSKNTATVNTRTKEPIEKYPINSKISKE